MEVGILNIYLREGRGRDDTIDPHYLTSNLATSGDISSIIEAVEQIQAILNGSGTTTGIVSQVQELNEKVDELSEIAKIEVLYKTTDEWKNYSEVSQKGILYVYSDATIIDGQTVPRIKIGNGVNQVKDLYFVDQDIVNALNNLVLVTEEEKESWNNKVSCSIDPERENLIFTTN